jgi:hypothetical protein
LFLAESVSVTGVFYRNVLLFVFASILAGCTSPHGTTRLEGDYSWSEVTQKDFELVRTLIREVLYSGKAGKYHVMFVSLNGKEPPEELIEGLSSDNIFLKPISAVAKGGERGVFDSKMGEPGFIMTIERLKWLSETMVECRLHFFAGPLAASAETFTANKIKNQWKVTDRKVIDES